MKFARSLFLGLVLGFALVGFVSQPLHAADISITAGSVVPDAGYQYQDTTAGATITAGQVVYIDTSNTAQLAKNDSAVHAAARGIALHGASSGQPLKIMTGGTVTIGGTSAAGTIYVVSATGGGVAPSGDLGTGKYVTILGVGVSTSKITLGIKASGVAVP